MGSASVWSFGAGRGVQRMLVPATHFVMGALALTRTTASSVYPMRRKIAMTFVGVIITGLERTAQNIVGSVTRLVMAAMDRILMIVWPVWRMLGLTRTGFVCVIRTGLGRVVRNIRVCVMLCACLPMDVRDPHLTIVSFAH